MVYEQYIVNRNQIKQKSIIIFIVASLGLLSLYYGQTQTITSRNLKTLSGSNPVEYHIMLQSIKDKSLEYYNLKEDGSLAPILSVYKEGGPVIATLVPNNEKDIEELKRALKSLKFLKGDTDPKMKAPVLIFHENNLSDDTKKELAEFTDRPVAFPIVDFSVFPDGFDPHNETVDFQVRGRDEWGYYQMIRFWVSGIWLHPAIAPYGTVMRIDSDSCFMEPSPTLPNFPSTQAVYHSQYVGLAPKKEFVKGLWDWNTAWMKKNQNKMSGNPMFWSYVKNTHELEQTLPLYRTNFELARKSFMQKRDVFKWNEAITEEEPFGIYRHRWGDAPIRFLMTAIFPQSEMVIMSRPAGYAHKTLCDPEKYAERYNLDLEKLKEGIEAEE